MNWRQLTEIRLKLGLTIVQMAKLLGVTESGYKRWKTRPNDVPNTIENSVEAHLALSKKALKTIYRARGIK